MKRFIWRKPFNTDSFLLWRRVELIQDWYVVVAKLVVLLFVLKKKTNTSLLSIDHTDWAEKEPEGATKRSVGNVVPVAEDEDGAIIVVIGIVPVDCIGCNAVNTSALGTTEKVKFGLFKSDESSARRLFGGWVSLLSVYEEDRHCLNRTIILFTDWMRRGLTSGLFVDRACWILSR